MRKEVTIDSMNIQMKTMTGACVPMITPMTESGNIDYNSVKRLTNHLIIRGCAALYPCGTTGEVMNLSVEERKKIVRTVISAADGRVPIFAQVGGVYTDAALDLAADARDAGADGLGILTPTYYPLSDEELLQYYVKLSKSVPKDFPIYIYGIPGLAVNHLSPQLVGRIADACENIIGIKYSVSDILTLMAFKEIRGKKFRVLAAPAQMLLPALTIGVDGIISGNCNVFIEDINQMFELFKAGKLEDGRALQSRLARLAEAMGEKEAAKCKALLYRKGVIASDVMRSPQTGLEESEKRELFAFVDSNYDSYSYVPE